MQVRTIFVCSIVGLVLLASSATGLAQDGSSQSTSNPTEEVVVKGIKPESVKRAQRLRIERLRAQLLKDFRENEVLAAKYGWNENNLIRKRESRFKWGYDPQDDMASGRYAQPVHGQWVETQPVSVFRMKF